MSVTLFCRAGGGVKLKFTRKHAEMQVLRPAVDQFRLTDGEKSDVRASALLNGTQVGMGAAFSTNLGMQRMGHHWILC